MSNNSTFPTPNWSQLVRDKVDSLRFGSVLITVHAGKVVQIERIERTRLDVPRPTGGLGFDSHGA